MEELKSPWKGEAGAPAIEHHIFFHSECGCNGQRGITCFKHKLKSIQFSGRGKSPQTKMEAGWERDMPAYQRLRMNGLQPPQIDGCAKLEKEANDQLEIEMGDLVGKVLATTDADTKMKRRTTLGKISEGMALARDIQDTWNPVYSVEDHKKRNVRPYQKTVEPS